MGHGAKWGFGPKGAPTLEFRKRFVVRHGRFNALSNPAPLAA